MKKLIALLMLLSFVTVNTAGAFAEQRPNERGRISGKIERRDSDRRINVRRPDSSRERRLSRRSASQERRFYENRNARRGDSLSRRSRPMARGNHSFFNRTRYYNRRPMVQHRPYYYGHSRRSSGVSALEFLGVSAAIIAIATAASHAHCDY